MFDRINYSLFPLLNADAGLAGWQLAAAVFAAEWIVMLLPLGLVLLWTLGSAAQREVAVRAFLAAAFALTFNMIIGQLWYHPRPFVAGIGQTFMHHAADSSFPSDHATSMFSVALVLAFSRVRAACYFGAVLLPLSLVVAWSRVFLGVHWPVDIMGALVVSAGMALAMSSRSAVAACAAILPMMEAIYRRVMAAPIARGWLRP